MPGVQSPFCPQVRGEFKGCNPTKIKYYQLVDNCQITNEEKSKEAQHPYYYI